MDQFDRDVATTKQFAAGAGRPDDLRAKAMRRWVWNYGDAPQGWPPELGYWIGQRLWQRWYDRQPEKRAAVLEMLSIPDVYAVYDAPDANGRRSV